jgi:Fic family protein
MRKTDLVPELQATCVPVPGRSGCYAVVPPPAPRSLALPACYGLMALARRELEDLAATIEANQEHASLVLWMLNRREAVDSSQIEGTRTQFDGLLLHELEIGTADARHDADASETYAYVRAFSAASDKVRSLGKGALSLDLITGIHGDLMAGQIRSAPGRLREIQNFIGPSLETARYIPPPPTEVPNLMADLVALLQYEPEGVKEVSILIRAAIAHAQFEAIHPFLDGNGRTGRLLLPLMFQAAGQPPIHLATFLKVRQREYYDALLAVQMRLDWTPWLTLFLECVIASCRHTVQIFAALKALHLQWKNQLAGLRKRRHAAAWRLVDLLLGQPVITVNQVVRQLGVTFPAANQAVNELVTLDILRPAGDQRRDRVFHAHQVMNALYTGLDLVLEQASRLGSP